MSDTKSLLDHERRITELEGAIRMHVPALLERLQRLESAAEQERVNREQADRKEMAELRRRADDAEARLLTGK